MITEQVFITLVAALVYVCRDGGMRDERGRRLAAPEGFLPSDPAVGGFSIVQHQNTDPDWIFNTG